MHSPSGTTPEAWLRVEKAWQLGTARLPSLKRATKPITSWGTQCLYAGTEQAGFRRYAWEFFQKKGLHHPHLLSQIMDIDMTI